MYPPSYGHNNQYVSLPNDDPENTQIEDQIYISPSAPRNLAKRIWFRPVLLTVLALFVVIVLPALFLHAPKRLEERPTKLEPPEPQETPEPGFKWPNDSFMFEGHGKPEYLGTPVSEPLVIRLSIISRVEAYDRRQALRDAMLTGIRHSELDIDYRFFIGREKDDAEWEAVIPHIREENRTYNDMVILDTVQDIAERVSEKRFAALKWAGSVSPEKYDWAVTLDSDTFCRLHVLARRLRYIYSDIHPRRQPALIGRMLSGTLYFMNTVPDGSEASLDGDTVIKGPLYQYPAGIGYVLSSNLTATILNVEPAVAHHVHYPRDDVMVGAWIAALKYFPDGESKFVSTTEPVEPAYPRPYYPYSIETRTEDDVTGWHDFKGRGGHDNSIGWDSACIHRVGVDEMRELRKLDELKAEWENTPT
ncbi:hypothetical protein CPC08DRAFT_713822 [Agrocybe pediades]|nr:hypothetical protein CPC08DRAFT_713822 [Agrocybe pediades]